MSTRSLQHREAVERFELLTVDAYDVTLDLASDARTFTSRTVVRFRSGAGRTFLDVKPVRLVSLRLDGSELPVDALEEGRYPLDLTDGEHQVEAEAVMPFRNDGEGLHRATDPVDGLDYVYGMSFMSAAPSIFACFDQPDLKAPYTFHVTAPESWVVRGNAPATRVEPGRWELEETRPLATYFVCLVAGPYAVVEDRHDDIDLALLSRRSLGPTLHREADELLTVTRQGFDALHELFGIRYPFGKYDQAFVPEFNAGAMENPGLVTFRDPYLFTDRPSRAQRVQRATTITHEMAHQWFGNLTSPKWWDDLWLNEAFAEYLGNRVAAAATEFTDGLTWASLSRKNWGLSADSRPTTHPVAGNGAVDADAALQDFDGISYAKGHALLTQLAGRLGDDVFLGGVRRHLERHRFGNATMRDLCDAWEEAGAEDLDGWVRTWLSTAGADRLLYDRAAQELVRTPPEGQAPVDRSHALDVAVWRGAEWELLSVVTTGDRTPLPVGDDPIVLDASDTAWADLGFDDVTAAALPDLFPRTSDPTLRTTLWNTIRNGVHAGHLSPGAALDVLVAGIPDEEQDTALTMTTTWVTHDGEGTRGNVHGKLVPLLADPVGGLQRLNDAFLRRTATAAAGSELRLAAFRGAVGTAQDADWLEGVLHGGVPEGVDLDDDLRWRVLRRLTALGGTDLDRLDQELAASSDARTRLWHDWCHARLPDADAKAWAWQRFTGEADASNYQIEAIGTGMWDQHQGDLLAPYAERYLDEVAGTTRVRAGWVLADAALFFYPITTMSERVLDGTRALCELPDLDPSLRRVLLDAGDELRRRLASREPVVGAAR